MSVTERLSPKYLMTERLSPEYLITERLSPEYLHSHAPQFTGSGEEVGLSGRALFCSLAQVQQRAQA